MHLASIRTYQVHKTKVHKYVGYQPVLNAFYRLPLADTVTTTTTKTDTNNKERVLTLPLTVSASSLGLNRSPLPDRKGGLLTLSSGYGSLSRTLSKEASMNLQQSTVACHSGTPELF